MGTTLIHGTEWCRQQEHLLGGRTDKRYRYERPSAWIFWNARHQSVNTALPSPLVATAIKKLAINPQGLQNFYDMFSSDMIYKAIEGSIKNIT